MNRQSIPSMYMVVPPHIQKDKNLNWSAKILYASIEQLCGLEEECCFSSNEYFAEKLDIEIRSVRRILEHLKNLKYIEVELGTGPKGSIRKIYLSKSENDVQGGHFVPPREDTVVLHNKSKSKSLNSSSLSEKTKTDSIADEAAQSDLELRRERRKSQRLRKTLFPKNFSLAQSNIEKLLSEHPITQKDIDFCLAEFTEYHTEGDGQIKKHINWEMTFTKWVGRAIDYGKIGKNKRTNEISQRTTPTKRACKDCTADKKCNMHQKLANLKTDPRYARNS